MALPAGLDAFDHLATMVALADAAGRCLSVNAAFELAMAQSRRSLVGSSVFDWLADAQPLREALRMVASDEVTSGRFEALLHRTGAGGIAMHQEVPVHVTLSPFERTGLVIIECVEVEQQARLDRDERTHGQAAANKELVRNLAHEIKNPLGGIRGAAQLLQMEVQGRELTEYTQVIIREADRLQALVDRLLAPHRRALVVGDVNIHEVLERVRQLVLIEHPRGLAVVRDYDVSIPEFRGDREHLLQAVLNIVQNAAQALAARIDDGDARIVLRTRVARQVTIDRQRWRLALDLHVEDNGPGVPAALGERIFHPLVSGRDGGSGLGLTLAQTFVQQHRGTIECDSAPGRTVFKLLLPLP